ncbi:MAG: serine hydrolase [Bacteroidales bacterium]|nr:serine hydrolase [Bacteroidales bacterium]
MSFLNFLSRQSRTLLLLLLCLTFGLSLLGNDSNGGNEPSGSVSWVDSVYAALTPQQRVAQLIMIRAYSTGDSSEIKQIASWIEKYNLGGICFFKGGPVRQAAITNYYQSLAKTPILISMDAEWGLGMRLDSTFSFARQMTLGAMSDESLIVSYGVEIARQLRRMGVQVSFSPVADINNNPANPVINVRSFGEDKNAVARKAILYMRGLQKGGVMSVAKHFPGHGDTDTDSHLALPYINHSIETFDTLDLFPFRKLIDSGIDGVMIAHLFVPAIDSSRNLPSSLSPVVINKMLRNEMKFDGLVFTDALDMKGAAEFAPPGMLEVKALQAGNDVLLLPESVDSAISRILMAVDSGWISNDQLEKRCKRVLAAKYKFGITQHENINLNGLLEDLNAPSADELNRRLYSSAITLLVNKGDVLPVERLDTLKIASVTFGYKDETLFQQRLSNYATIDIYCYSKETSLKSAERIIEQLKDYNLLLISVNNTHPSPAKNFGFSRDEIELVDTLLALKPSVLNLFALPYSVNMFRNAAKAKAILVSYQDNATAYDLSAQAIFGAIPFKGHTPVSISSRFPLNAGVKTSANRKLSYGIPEDAGISTASFKAIDSLAMLGITEKAYPGCQVLVAVKGKVIYSKSFGYHDYLNKQAVVNSDIYDLASVTKVASTTLATMKLHDQGKINPAKPLSKYLPQLSSGNKSKITVQEVMTHQAGLLAWIPFYKFTLNQGRMDSTIFRKVYDSVFSVRVANNLFIHKDYPARIIDSIVHSPLLPVKEYKYSDLGFMLLQQAVEHQSGKPLNQFVEEEFYRPLGLSTMGYLPLNRFSLDRIIPTENDTIFRKQLIHGYVHDPAAAMLGGVAGHAGLFGNANDLAVLFQMLLQHGYYGGRRYLDNATVVEFTARQFPSNRRGLGFDKPQPAGQDGPVCAAASPSSFGHTGFTGTFVWADPAKDLIIVFLSNRVNPDAEDNKLARMGIRTKIQQVVYDALEKQVRPKVQQTIQQKSNSRSVK